MSDEPAKIILGDIAISAIERKSQRGWLRRRKGKELPHLSHCENCGTKLTGHYCSQCGQAAIDYRRSFGHVILDVLNEFLNWDSKFFGTLGLLITRPWRLTNEFVEGKRVRHVHPLRLYLLASVLFFFAVNYGAKGLKLDLGKIPEEKRAEVAAAIADKRAEIEKELQKENLSPDDRKKAREVLDYLTKPSPSPTASASPKSTASPTPSSVPSASPTESTQRKYGAVGDRPFLVFDENEKTSTPFERWLEARAKEKMGEHGTKMGLFITTLFSNLPYMMLCCIPLFAFVLKVLYIRRHIFYIDHLIYALHIHSFFYTGIMLIVLATMGLNRSIPGTFADWVIALLWITFVVQIFLSIRYVYRQGWFISTLKFFIGGFVYLIVLFLALAATFFITLAIPT
jgi:ribosomal protein L32